MTAKTLQETPPGRHRGQDGREPKQFDRTVVVKVKPVIAIGTKEIGDGPKGISKTVEFISDKEITEFDRETVTEDDTSEGGT